jgi:hypothetical protein
LRTSMVCEIGLDKNRIPSDSIRTKLCARWFLSFSIKDVSIEAHKEKNTNQ